MEIHLMNSKYHLLLLGAIAGALFLVNLGGYDLWPPDEPRFAQVSREMADSGDYLVPRVNGQPYKEKPPLLFWAQCAMSLPFGDVTEFSARLPSVLAGIITVLLTYLLVRRLFDARTGFWAALILITTQRIWWQSRFGQIDMLLTACVTAAFLFFWIWYSERRNIYLVGFYLSMAAGVLAKGPPAIVFPLLMALTFFWRQKEDRKELHLFLGLAVVAILVSAWLIPARMAITTDPSVNAGDAIGINLFRQTIGRFFLGVSHANPPWYYLMKLPVDLFPWSIFLPWTVVWVWRQRRSGEAMRFLLSWIVPAFIFFSICSGKRAVYLLPLFPSFAALLACSVLALMDGERNRWRTWTGAAWGGILMLAGLAPFGLFLTAYSEFWENSMLAWVVCSFCCAGYTFWMITRSTSRKLAKVIVVQSSVLFVFVATVLFPLMNPHKSAKVFCFPLLKLSQADVEYNLYSFGFSREEFIYYSEHFHRAIPQGLQPCEGMENLAPRQQVAFQRAMLRGFQKAVKDVPIAIISSVSDEEIRQLERTLREEGPVPHGNEKLAQAFKTAMQSRLENLLTEMDGEQPTFIITRERDWRWFLATCPDARERPIVMDENVGSRHVLLVANRAGRNEIARLVR
jgi:4-amino-4-deoxy-L-arabinose transferase-like glycosyltransferase